tara:strand:+ start:14349 stop:15464 length:1116 start_codon:yes stop_codon:yes gene_type:complete
MTAMFILENLSNGGAQRVVASLFPHLDNRLNAQLVVLTNKIDYQFEKDKKINIHYLNASRILFSLPKLSLHLFKQKPKIVFSSIFFTDVIVYFLTRVFSPRSKIVLRSCNFYSKAYPNKKSLLARLVLYVYKNADKVICSTQEMKEDFLDLAPELKDTISVIYNPVNISLVQHCSKVFIPPEFSDEVYPFTFIAVAKLKKQKNLSLLIKSFSLIKEKHARLLILGQGEMLAHLKDELTVLNLTEQVTFLGFHPNPYPYISHADCLILSSDYEGFPNVIIEAMALDTAVISTRCSSGPSEIIQHNMNGLLVPVNNEKEMSEMMQYLMQNSDLSKKLSSQALKGVEQYDVQNISRDVSQCLVDFIGISSKSLK